MSEALEEQSVPSLWFPPRSLFAQGGPQRQRGQLHILKEPKNSWQKFLSPPAQGSSLSNTASPSPTPSTVTPLPASRWHRHHGEPQSHHTPIQGTRSCPGANPRPDPQGCWCPSGAQKCLGRGWGAGGLIQPLHPRRFPMDRLHRDVSRRPPAQPTAVVGMRRPRRLNLIQAN